MKEIEVVAAVIVDDHGRVLIARRNQSKSLPGKWEFPGGKVEPGESQEKALERELLEEFSIRTITKDFVGLSIHDYGHFTIKLFAYLSDFHSGTLVFTDHDKIEWAPVEKLTNFDLAPADIPLVAFIKDKLKV